MNRKVKTRITQILATLLTLPMVFVGMHPAVIALNSACNCDLNTTVEAEFSTKTCCGTKAGPISVIKSTGPCCCNPEKNTCECGECRCGKDDTNSPSLPAIPVNETIEIVVTCVTYFPSFDCVPRLVIDPLFETPTSIAILATHSSLETCILLSRFTC